MQSNRQSKRISMKIQTFPYSLIFKLNSLMRQMWIYVTMKTTLLCTRRVWHRDLYVNGFIRKISLRFWSIFYFLKDIVQLLITHNADINLLNSDGRKAKNLTNNKDIIQIIESMLHDICLMRVLLPIRHLYVFWN